MSAPGRRHGVGTATLAATVAGALLAGGCTPSAPRITERARKLIDGTRECAALFNGSSPLEAPEFILRTDSIDSLVRAGLFRYVALGMRRSLEGSPPKPWVRLEPTPEGRRWLVSSPPNPSGVRPGTALCFARRQLVDARRVELEPGYGWRVALRYRLIDRAPWSARPDVRRAFPFLDRVAARALRSSYSAIPDRLGRLKLAGNPEEMSIFDDPRAAFDACSLDPAAPDGTRCG